MFKAVLLTLTKTGAYTRVPQIFKCDLHLSKSSFSPRFGSNPPTTTLTEEQEHDFEEPNDSKTNQKPYKDQDLQAWNQVEKEMYHQKRSPLLKVPMSDFTKLRWEQNKAQQQQLFDMRKIDQETLNAQSQPYKKQMKKKSALKPPETITDPEIGEYLKLERDDPLIDDVFLTINSKKHQDRRQLLPLEGRRLIQDALNVGLQMKFLIFSKIEQVKLIADDLKRAKTKAKLMKVPNHNLKFWSQLSTTPGIIAIFERPLDMNTLIERTRPQQLPISIICDNIREPNNLGAMIRVAAAAGVDQVILTKGEI